MNQDAASRFFESLGRSDNEALLTIQEQVPAEGVPSPRAQELIDSGEWDSRLALALVPVPSEDICCGVVGQAVRGESRRFCTRVGCEIPAHRLKCPDVTLPGWFIDGGPRDDSGVFAEYRLPLAQDGGPIGDAAAMRLMDGDNRFRLSKGQWKFLIMEWHAARVDTFSSQASPTDQEAEASPTDQEAETLAAEILAAETRADVTLIAGRGGIEEAKEFNFDSSDSDTGTPGDRDALRRRVAEMEGKLLELELLTNEQEKRLEQYVVDFGELKTALGPYTSGDNVLGQDIQRLDNRIRTLEGRNLGGRAVSGGCAQDADFKALLRRVLAVEKAQAPGNTSRDLEARVVKVESGLFDPTGPVQHLRLSFQKLNDKLADGGGVNCHGVIFPCKKDLMAWWNTRNLDISMFADAQALLHAIKPPVTHTDDAVRSMESRAKIKMKSPLQQAVETSYDTVLAGMLVGNAKVKGDVTGGVYDFLKAYLKSREVWKSADRSGGVRRQIIEGIPRVQARIQEIRSRVTTDPEALNLSAGLVNDSAQFLRDLVVFVDDLYDELMANSKHTPAAIWDLIVECLATVFEELSDARGQIADAAGWSSTSTGLYLWGMIRAWEVQQRLSRNQIKNDPTLTGILVRRILLHGDADKTLRDQLAKIDPLETRVDAQHKSFEGEIKGLRKRVVELEKSPKA